MEPWQANNLEGQIAILYPHSRSEPPARYFIQALLQFDKKYIFRCKKVFPRSRRIGGRYIHISADSIEKTVLLK